MGQTTVPYCATDNSSGYEIGLGTLTTGSPDTLSRDDILISSNANAAVNWASGTKQIFAWDIGAIPNITGYAVLSGV